MRAAASACFSSSSSSRISCWPVRRKTSCVGFLVQSMPPSASNSSPSASKRLNLRLLEPALQTRIFVFVSGITVPWRKLFGLAANMPSIVPQPDDWLREVVFVAQRTQTRGAQHEVSSDHGIESEPPRGQYAQEMPAGEQQHVACDGAHAFHHT